MLIFTLNQLTLPVRYRSSVVENRIVEEESERTKTKGIQNALVNSQKKKNMQSLLASTWSFPFHQPSHPARHKISTPYLLKPLCVQRQESTTSPTTSWPSVTLSLFGSGFFFGPLLDGLHSRVNLVVYRSGSIDIGPLHTNIWVPFLLGSFYCVLGLLQLYLDQRVFNNVQDGSFPKTIASLISVALFIEVSAEMYKAGIADNTEAYILFAAAELLWFLLDRSWPGFTLACLVGLACPLAEIPLMKLFNLWYYPQANVEIFGQGLVTWTATCYFAYTFFVINLSRWFRTVFTSNTDNSA